MKKLLLPILILMLSAVSANAVWDTDFGVFRVTDKDFVNLGKHSLKIDQVIIEEETVYFTIRKDGQDIDSSYVSIGQPYEMENTLQLKLQGFKNGYALLQIIPWVQAEFVKYNFPEQMYLDERYNTWVEVKNTGAEDAMFRVEIVEEGRATRYGRTYETPEHESVLSLLDVQIPIKFKAIQSETAERVNFHVASNRRQAASGGTGLFRIGTVLYNLYYGDHLLDTIRIPDVEVSIFPKSGYISDVIVPDVMIKNVEYNAAAFLQNTGKLQSSTASHKLRFGIKQPANFDMNPEVIADEIPAHTSATWPFKIKAREAGNQEVTFEFYHFNAFTNEKLLFDTFTSSVEVLDGFVIKIDNLIVPDEINLGSKFQAEAIIKNYGPAKQINLVLSSPTLSEIPKKKLIALEPHSQYVTTFDLEAIAPGENEITLDIYEKEGSKYDTNINPYSEGELITSKAVKLNVKTQEYDKYKVQEKPSEPVEPETTEDIKPDVKEVEETVVVQPPVVEKEEPKVPFYEEHQELVVTLGAIGLILLLLLITKVVTTKR